MCHVNTLSVSESVGSQALAVVGAHGARIVLFEKISHICDVWRVFKRFLQINECHLDECIMKAERQLQESVPAGSETVSSSDARHSSASFNLQRINLKLHSAHTVSHKHVLLNTKLPFSFQKRNISCIYSDRFPCEQKYSLVLSQVLYVIKGF